MLIPAVWKKTTNLKLHFFSNHPEIDKLRKEKSDACQVTNGIGELDKDISKEMNGVDKETKGTCIPVCVYITLMIRWHHFKIANLKLIKFAKALLYM